MLEPSTQPANAGETVHVKVEYGSASGGPSNVETDPFGSAALSATETAVRVKNEILREWITETVSANKFFKMGPDIRVSKTLKNCRRQNIAQHPMELCELVVNSDTPEADSDSDSETDADPSNKSEASGLPLNLIPNLNADLILGGENQIAALKNQGCCKRDCTKYFSVEELLTYNLESKNLDYKVDGINLLDFTILAQMKGMCRTLDQVKSGKTSKEKVRERLRMICTLGGVSVCEKVFLLANGIKVKRFKRLLKSYKQNGLRPNRHGNSKKAKSAVTLEVLKDKIPEVPIFPITADEPKDYSLHQ